MPAGFRKIQVGKETTKGTAVAATKILLGQLSLTPEVSWFRPQDDDGLNVSRRAFVVSQGSRVRLTSELSYEQLTDILLMALKGGITPTTPVNATVAKDWVFVVPPNATTSPDSYTIEFGDNQQVWEANYCQVSSLQLQASLGSPLVATADIFGRFAQLSNFTGAISLPTTTPILSSNLKVFIASTWAGLGTNQISNTVAGLTVNINTGLFPFRAANGSLDFAFSSEGRKSIDVDMDLVFNANAQSEYGAYTAGTLRAVRLEWTGPVIETGFNHRLQVDFLAKYTSPPELFGEQDGEDIIRMKLESVTDGTNHLAVNLRNKVIAV